MKMKMYWICVFIFFHGITVDYCRTLAKEFCRRDFLEFDEHAQAVITAVFAIRNTTTIHPMDRRSLSSGRSNQVNRRKIQDGNTTGPSSGPMRKSCGPVSSRGLQLLLAIDWVVNILNSKSDDVFGIPVNDSFIPGVKLGFRTYDTCGLEYLAVSHLVESYADFYSPGQRCTSNRTTFNAGAIVDELNDDDLLDAANYMKLISQPLLTLSSLTEGLTDNAKYGNVFSTLPSIRTKAEAMIRVARQLGWTHVTVIFEDSSYGKEGKRQLFNLSKDHDLCILNFYGVPAINGYHDSNSSTIRKQLERVLGQVVENLPHAPVVFIFATELTSVFMLQVSANNSYAAQLRWILSDFIKQSALFGWMYSVRGLFALAADSPPDVPEFRDYWRNFAVRSSNGWFRDYYQETLGCRFTDEVNPNFKSLPLCPENAAFLLGDVDPDIVVTPETVSVIDGIYLLAGTLRKAWESRCRRPGLCPKLSKTAPAEFLELMRTMEFKYDITSRSPPSLSGRRINFRLAAPDSLAIYELVEHEKQLMFIEVFTVQAGQLDVTGQPLFYSPNGSTSTNAPPSTCSSGQGSITSCACSRPNSEDDAGPIYKQGDVLVAGVFPIHSSILNVGGLGFDCGAIRQREGYQLAEAFWYAVDKVNDKRAHPFSSILPGVSLGTLTLDSCNSPPRASYLASSLIINANSLGPSASGKHSELQGFKNRDILALIGDLGDETSAELASVLRYANLVQLSYGARSAGLGDHHAYPTLLRTIVSDNARLNMTFNALRQLGWDYVQVVSTDTGYGRSMSKMFQMEALQFGVCIAQSLTISSSNSSAADVVEALFQQSNANVVILFVEKKPLRSLLGHLQRVYESSATQRFVLIAADHWYNDPQLVKGVELAAEGALAFAARRLANQQFQKHIAARAVTAGEKNPWLMEYIESAMHCNFPGTDTRQYSASCNPAVSFGQIPGFRVDLATNDVINAVYAFAFGLHAMLIDYCGKGYHGVCKAFETLSNRNSLLYDYVRRATFEDETGRIFAFSDQRDAAIPVAVLHVRRNSSGGSVHYAQAGLYSSLNASERQSFIQPATIRALRSRTTSNCVSNNSYNCEECRRFYPDTFSLAFSTTSPPSSTQSTAPPATTSNDTRNRSDRNLAARPTSRDSLPKKFVYIPSADKILLGAVFPLHGRTGASSPFQCGEILEEGVLMTEAFLWALDTIKANSDSLRFDLGTVIVDSCSNPGQVFHDLKELYTKSVDYFTTNGTDPLNPDEIIGFLNDPLDDGTMSTELLASLNVTNFGIGSLSTAVTDKTSPFSVHMLSPLKVHHAAVLSFLQRMNWSYVSVVYSGRRWGMDAYLRLKSDALDRGFCFGAEIMVHGYESSSHYDKAVLELETKIWQPADGVSVVVLLLDKEEASLFLRAIARSIAKGNSSLDNRFVFIGTASWGDSIPFKEGEEQAALGSIVFQHDSQTVDAFRVYIEGLRYDNERNPWWQEYWRRKFKCDDDDTCRKYTMDENSFQNEALYTNIMNAVWAASVGLNNLCTSSAKRRQQQSPCRAIQKAKNFRQRFFDSVRGSGFNRVDNPQESFRFTNDGWSDSGFYILNLLQDEAGGLEYKAVGRYADTTGLTLSDVPYGYDKSSASVPLEKLKSKCTDPKMCPQCVTRMQNVPDTGASSSTTPDLTRASTTSNPGPFSLPSTAALIPAYGVHLSNSTYTDAFLYAPGSADSHLIAVAFPIHARGPRPFSCGPLRREHYQNLQAFLWALKIGREDESLFPNANLGALIFDTCSDAAKAIRDLSNFLSEQVVFRTANGEKIDPNRTLAVLNSPYTEEALPIADLMASYGIPNVSPGLSASMMTLADTYKAAMTLRTSVPTDVQARAMVALLKQIGWSAVSVLFTDNVWGLNGQTDFRTEANHNNVCIVLSETIPESGEPTCSEFAPKVDDTISRLLAAKNSANIRGVVAWLTEDSLRCLLLGVKKAIDRGSMKPGDLTVILPADIADLQATVIDQFQREVNGFIALQYAASLVEPFRQYWQALDSSDELAGHHWSKEYQEQSMGNYRQNAYLLNTINAVFSIGVSLEQLRRNVCSTDENPNADRNLCPQLLQNSQAKLLLLDAIRKVDFVDLTGKRFRFVHDSFGNEGITISNFVMKDKEAELLQIGSYESEQLKLQLPPQGFDALRQSSFNLADQAPSCTKGEQSHICAVCSTRKAHSAELPGLEDTSTIANSQSLTEPTTKFDPWQQSLATQQLNQSTSYKYIAESPVLSPQSQSNSSTVPTQMVVGSARMAKDVIVLPASRRFTVIGLFPVHKRGPTSLSCEGFNAITGFQSLAAFLFAVDEVNKDQYLLPGVQLGAVAVDYCGSEERALADLFEILSPSSGVVGSDDLIAAVGFDHRNGGHEAEGFFRRLRVPVVNSGPAPIASRDDTFTFGTVPADDVYPKIAVEIFRQMKWTYFSHLYETDIAFEPTAKLFEDSLTADRSACLARAVSLRSDASLEEAQLAVRQLVSATGSKAVAMFLSDRNTLQVLKAVVAENVPTGRFVFVTKFNDDWTQDASFLIPLQRFGQGLVTVELDRRNSTNFANFLSSLTLSNHAPFPTPWFEEFWQQIFQCFLPDASSPNQQFPNACTGEERMTQENFIQGGSVLPTILAVHTVARGLHRFLMQNCPSQPVDSLSACMDASPYKVSDMDPRTELTKAFRAVNFSYVYGTQTEFVQADFVSNRFLDAEYLVRNMIREADGNFEAQEVGVWRTSAGLLLDVSQVVIHDGQGEKKSPLSKCSGEICSSICDQRGRYVQNYSSSTPEMKQSATPGPSASLYFNSVWGIVVAAVAGLGMVTCVVCIIYFSVTFPISHGTTILGYMILFGLIVLYGLAFAYVVAPTALSCSVRRFCTGICWAFVFSPMLIKVFHAWHTRQSLMKPPARLDNPVSPCSLFILAMGIICVQIIIAVEWMILQSPDGVVYLTSFSGEPLASSGGGVWRCSPGETFETVVIISTVYVMFILFLTTLFSLITWNVDEQNHESRWIFLACATSIACWLIWTLLSTRLEYKLRDPAIAIGIVVDATIILLCLYLRKAYLYSKYRREAKEVVFDNQSAVYLTSTLASGGQIMLDTSILYDGKMLPGTNGNLCGLRSSPSILQAPMPSARRHCLPVPTPLSPNGTGLSGSRSSSEGKTILYSNAAFEGGCEFNPGGRSDLNAGVLLYNGKANGSIASSTPTNHRF